MNKKEIERCTAGPEVDNLVAVILGYRYREGPGQWVDDKTGAVVAEGWNAPKFSTDGVWAIDVAAFLNITVGVDVPEKASPLDLCKAVLFWDYQQREAEIKKQYPGYKGWDE